MDSEELERRLAAFPDWLYEFRFDGDVRTPVANRTMVNRQQERYRYFFEALLRVTGGSLRGRRVLDLGCNAGFWSLAAAEAGADFVLGVDAQQSYLDQAALVFEAKQVDPDRYRFERGNILEHEFAENYDVVLCLGLMSHVCKPFELFEVMAGVAPELIVIDTEVSRSRLSIFELAAPYKAEDSVEYPLVMVPSPAAVEQLAAQFGFSSIALAPRIGERAGMSDYLRRRRLAFICSRGPSPTDGLEAHPGRSLLPWWVRDPRALLSALH
ncbi:MAG: class I SAM-dependent methyltransferase [Solirubrobacteraceae bacterium]